MGVFMVPPIGAGVWVEFEHGDPNQPIWIGCRWDSTADMPPLAHRAAADPAGQNIVIQTPLQNLLIISDSPPTPATGGIMLKSATGAMLVVNDSGIYINNGKGAIDHADRPDRDDQQRRAGRHLTKGRRTMPGFLRSRRRARCCARTRGRRRRPRRTRA